MRVKDAFESQEALWQALDEDARLAKAASRHKLGDLFQPGRTPGDPFDPQSYVTPCKGHVHLGGNGWYKDIAYLGRSKRRAALLVGDPEQSFVWDRPMVAAPFNLPRDYTTKRLDELLGPSEEGGSQ